MSTAHHPVEATFQRIIRLSWVHSVTQSRSARQKQGLQTGAKLFQEYLRRMALWSQALNAEQWPFFDVAARINPTVRADALYIRQLSKSLFPNTFVWASAHWILHWAALDGRPEARAYDLPAPYSPLLRFYEYGLWFRHEQDAALIWHAATGKKQAFPLHIQRYNRPRPFIELK